MNETISKSDSEILLDTDIEISDTPEDSIAYKNVIEKIKDQVISPETRVDSLEKDHENLHSTIQVLLSTSGLLLTICLGAIYFSYNSTSKIEIPVITKGSLFVCVLLLSLSVLANAHILRLKPPAPVDKNEYADNLYNIYKKEKPYVNKSVLLLEGANIFIIIGILIFAWDRLHLYYMYNTNNTLIEPELLLNLLSLLFFIPHIISDYIAYQITDWYAGFFSFLF
jgi:hypothetical protein